MSEHEYECYSEEEEISDLSNPAVVLKYKTAAEIVNKALKGVITQVILLVISLVVVCSWKACYWCLRFRWSPHWKAMRRYLQEQGYWKGYCFPYLHFRQRCRLPLLSFPCWIYHSQGWWCCQDWSRLLHRWLRCSRCQHHHHSRWSHDWREEGWNRTSVDFLSNA